MTKLGYTALAAYIAVIVGANLAVQRYGLVPVGFGLLAPAGVYLVGLGFTLRDLVHRTLGPWWVLAGIAAGAAVSFAVASPALAAASAAAFGFSELADMAVYTPLAKRHWLTAVTASNTVGLAVDSALFLWLAFGSLTYLPGQIVGKAWMTGLAVVILWAGRYAMRRRAAVTVTGAALITAERRRQITAEGWMPEHDAEHADDELARAAACYAMPDRYRELRLWPWRPGWWKPSPDDRVRELVKAGALIAAEIDRLRTGETA